MCCRLLSFWDTAWRSRVFVHCSYVAKEIANVCTQAVKIQNVNVFSIEPVLAKFEMTYHISINKTNSWLFNLYWKLYLIPFEENISKGVWNGLRLSPGEIYICTTFQRKLRPASRTCFTAIKLKSSSITELSRWRNLYFIWAKRIG